jgi:putative sigma-54 modulation protein
MTMWPEQVSASQELEHKLELGTQLTVYSKQTLGAGFQNLIEMRLAATLRGIDTRVERVIVRFEDLNGPKGGADTACRIQLALSGRPVFVVEARAEGAGRAFRLALPRLATALTRQRDRERSRPRATLRFRQAS